MRLAAVSLALLVSCSSKKVHEGSLPPAVDEQGLQISTSAERLGSNYLMNEVAADHRYKDHWFMIHGLVRAVVRDRAGAPLVILETGTPRFVVTAFLAGETDVERLARGSAAALYCIGDGLDDDGPRLRSCEIR